MNTSNTDYSAFDIPEILSVLFHPRPEYGTRETDNSYIELTIPVDDNVSIGGRLYPAGKALPSILFFHGNGEIVSDYTDISPIFNDIGINFLPVDYRGYGRSTGTPTVSDMINDSHIILDWIQNRLKKESYNGPLILMGRSLGSASVLELASNYSDQIDGLIIESGFSKIEPLLKLFGVNIKGLGITEEDSRQNIQKIKKFHKPTLIIHAENDHIIAFSEGQALFENSPAENKRLLKILNADHNTIFFVGMSEYMEAIKELISEVNS
jgi:alpha-beta hydrolase superfamily lysophospholipase